MKLTSNIIGSTFLREGRLDLVQRAINYQTYSSLLLNAVRVM